jgi:hypothetical protein
MLYQLSYHTLSGWPGLEPGTLGFACEPRLVGCDTMQVVGLGLEPSVYALQSAPLQGREAEQCVSFSRRMQAPACETHRDVNQNQ